MLMFFTPFAVMRPYWMELLGLRPVISTPFLPLLDTSSANIWLNEPYWKHDVPLVKRTPSPPLAVMVLLLKKLDSVLSKNTPSPEFAEMVLLKRSMYPEQKASTPRLLGNDERENPSPMVLLSSVLPVLLLKTTPAPA